MSLPAPTTFTEFQDRVASEKIGLVTLDAARRQVLWTVVAGDIYSSPFDESDVIILLEDDGVALTEVFTSAVSPGEFFHDRDAEEIVLELSDSTNPTDSFIAVTFRLFFSNGGVKLAHDLSSGFEVEWLPLLRNTSTFTLQIDNQKTQLGSAIEGPGSVTLDNDQDFWKPRYDKFVFENKDAFVYSWNRNLAASEAKLIYKGKIQGKSYNLRQVGFSIKDTLNELRQPIPLERVEDFTYTHDVLGSISARVLQDLGQARQRLVYGRLNGHLLQGVDQTLDDGYPVSGTMTVTENSTTVTAVAGTSFDTELFQGDKLVFSNDLTLTENEIADFPTSTTTIRLTEAYGGATAVVSAQVIPGRNQQPRNRYWLVAGHALTRPSTTITEVFTARLFEIADGSEFEVGDGVIINTEKRNVSALTGVPIDTMEIDIELTSLPAVTDVVERSPISNLYIEGNEIVEGDDFTIDDDEALVFLKRAGITTPEFKITSTSEIGGTSWLFAGTRLVTGDATFLRPGDWILDPDAVWLQVWAVLSNAEFRTTVASASVVSSTPQFKRIQFVGSSSNVTADLTGKSDDGLSTGDLLRKGPEIVKDILEISGLSDLLNTASFDAANDKADHDLALAIPKNASDNDSQVLRDIINLINRSIYGVLFQNQAFELEYGLIDPGRSVTKLNLDKADALNFSVKSDSKSIVSTVNIFYNNREVDNKTLGPVSEIESFTSQNATLLAKTTKELDVQTVLLKQVSARIFASRWAVLLEFAKSLITIKLKMQAFSNDINDRVEFETSKLYERIGTKLNRKIGLISTIRRNLTGSELMFDDLASAFSRCATITENVADDFTAASDDEKMINGYITEDDGTLNTDKDTLGINLIW